MFRFLKQPYPLLIFRERLIYSVVISSFIYLFLRLLEPFDLNLLESENREWIILGYAINAFLLLFIFYVSTPLVFGKLFSETKWNVWRELIWMITILCFIGIWLAIYEHLIQTRRLSLFTIFETVLKTLVIGVLPISGMVLLNQIRLLKKNIRQANLLNARIDYSEMRVEKSDQVITIQSDNKSEIFQGKVDDILFLVADGNYVDVHHQTLQGVKRTILRTTLSKVASQLLNKDHFIRCHRSYIVNLRQILSVNGNASGLMLSFYDTEKTVPVARRNIIDFKNKFQQMT
jgi:hypothetical protein